MDRHLRKLDQELSKFKMELEADNAGITEVLEKREFQFHDVIDFFFCIILRNSEWLLFYFKFACIYM